MQQHVAELGQFHTLARALEQAHAQDFLQLLQCLGYGRLSDGQRIGRLHEASPASHFQKALDVAVFHPAINDHPFPPVMLII